MRILFLGGTGLISSAVSPLVVERGHDLTLVTRGESAKAALPHGARGIVADARDALALRAAVRADVAARGEYDAVVQWIGFDPDHVSDDIETFHGVTGQYVFISSASAYKTPPQALITTERTPLSNPYWQYSRDKAEAERRLREAGAERGFPFTIVRPSHTYGYADFPAAITSWTHPWTWVDRLLRGAPLLAHGDGTTPWTVTDHRDFAVGLAGLLGHSGAVGEDFHITGDEVLTWNQIHEAIAAAAGVDAGALHEQLLHVPTDVLVRMNREAFEGPLLGDKTHAAVFDTSKLRALVPDFATRHLLADGMRESYEWFMADPARRTIDHAANALWDDVATRYQRGIAEALRAE